MKLRNLYTLLVILTLVGCSREQDRSQAVTATAPVQTEVVQIVAGTPIGDHEMPQSTNAPTMSAPTQGHLSHATQSAMPAFEAGAPRVTGHTHVTAGPHVEIAPGEKPTVAELEQAERIRSAARTHFAKYRDYHQALADGYSVFAPEVPQDVYHFINYRESLQNHGLSDPLKPTALLYRKAGDSWEWYGVMYSAPYGTEPEALDAIYPRSLGEWHAHVNICAPSNASSWLDNLELAVSDPKFGFEGSIDTRAECEAVGGRFYRDVLGWMVHVDLSQLE